MLSCASAQRKNLQFFSIFANFLNLFEGNKMLSCEKIKQCQSVSFVNESRGQKMALKNASLIKAIRQDTDLQILHSKMQNLSKASRIKENLKSGLELKFLMENFKITPNSKIKTPNSIII